MNHYIRSLAVALTCFFLTGCELNSGRNWDPRYYRPRGKPRDQVLKEFVLYNEKNEEKGATVSGMGGRTPFGAMVAFNDYDYSHRICSVTHLIFGKVMLNSHCVTRGGARMSPKDIYIVYYDGFGRKKYSNVEAIEYAGDSEHDDIAVLKLKRNTALEWDVALGVPVDTSRVEPPAAKRIQILSYDPLEEDEAAEGMRFNVKTCLATRKRPVVVAIHPTSTEKVTIDFEKENELKADPSIHFYTDNCVLQPNHKTKGWPRPGNSGSLVIIDSEPMQWVGAFHWRMYSSPHWSASGYEVTGNLTTDKPESVVHDAVNEHEFYGTGTSIFDVEKLHPGLFTQSAKFDE